MPDGSVETNVVEQVPKLRPRMNQFNKDFDYIKDIKAAAVGDILSWPVPNERHEAFMKALSGSMIRYWGSGNYAVERGDNKISVLRG